MKCTNIDKRKITLLTTLSNDCLRDLNEKLKTVEYCEFLFLSCQKYESICEKLNKWLNKKIGLKYPYVGLPQSGEDKNSWIMKRDDLVSDDFVLEGQPLFSEGETEDPNFKGHRFVVDTKKIINKVFSTKRQSSKRSSAPPKLHLHSGKVRPETGISGKSKPSTSRDAQSTSTTDKPGVCTLSKVVIQAKPQPSTSSSGTSLTSNKIQEEVDNEELECMQVFDVDIGHLGKLENFWNLHSKVVVDMMDLKQEKKNLLYSNERMKVLLRLLLESAALQGGRVELETASSVSSMRSAVSATIRSMCR
ncbi:hypothetical protein WA026_000262 [Henosepilachna vigintioctopunctata]|uniref:Uncharacterized protein n=1 Tax=Henosepilachna vigintioctopunctata TaxID=420089 RepID=A0AAW1V723_9CUCU